LVNSPLYTDIIVLSYSPNVPTSSKSLDFNNISMSMITTHTKKAGHLIIVPLFKALALPYF